MSAAVSVCLRLIYQNIYRKSRGAAVSYSNYFGSDPKIFNPNVAKVGGLQSPEEHP
jgi:hypothetical protein